MIDTMPLTQAARFNEPRAMLVAADDFYRAAKAIPARPRALELAPLSTVMPSPAATLGKSTKSYLRHLETKFWIAFGTIYVSTILAYVCVINLFFFFDGGTNWFHPIISINLLMASVGLTVVAAVVHPHHSAFMPERL